jgi:splicing factor U2AF subunit
VGTGAVFGSYLAGNGGGGGVGIGGAALGHGLHSALMGGGVVGAVETPYVRLKGMVTRDELLDPQEAKEILEDTEEECRGFGSLVKLLMPLPAAEGLDPPGVGEVLLHFADVDSARRAQRSLNGRKFADRLVAAVFVSEAEFAARNAASGGAASALAVV